MVVAQTLEPTGLFENIGTRFLIATRGSGQRFLLGVFVLVAVLCAFLPNATTVILLAPIIIRIARALDVDFVGPMVVTAIISNSAGLLTLIGDPATYLVGSSIGMSFTEYLRKVTPRRCADDPGSDPAHARSSSRTSGTSGARCRPT